VYNYRAKSVKWRTHIIVAVIKRLVHRLRRLAKAPETTSGLLWPGAGPSAAKGYPLS